MEAVRDAFQRFHPTLVFYEGRAPEPSTNFDDAIRRGGESALLRILAREAATPARTLEPDPLEERRALLRTFPADQVELFYVLRRVAQLRSRLPADQVDEDAQRSINDEAQRLRQVGAEPPFETIASMAVAAERYWPGRDWRTASLDWFDPRRPSSETGGVFANEVNAASSAFRNLNMYRVMTAAVLEGQRVMAVVGRNHPIQQRPALICALSAQSL